ncbi:hypothetical protein WICANDRAFT_15027, partial [Wickerhamomyces anomalus NRRL Y-366-8]
MTQEKAMSDAEFADTYKKLNEGEKTATKIEQMLDDIESKMDELIKEAENINADPQD